MKLGKRTTPPDDLDHADETKSVPGDATRALLRQLRNSDDDERDNKPINAKVSAAPSSTSAVPPSIANVLVSPARGELIEIAKMLEQGAKQERFLIFYTPVGDIRCRINWQSCEPKDLHNNDNLFFVKMRSADVAFTPKAGAAFNIGFAGYAHSFSVVCLAPPQQLYPGVDLLCFLRQNSSMEKNGKLNEGAPSVVTGKPSNAVTADGEPIVKGEEAVAIDFDKVRDAQD